MKYQREHRRNDWLNRATWERSKRERGEKFCPLPEGRMDEDTGLEGSKYAVRIPPPPLHLSD